MAFEGDLSNLSLGDVLQTIAMSRQVGTFVIKGEDERRLACGPQGVALLSTRTSLGLRIGEVLVGSEKVSREKLDMALKVQRRRRDTPVGAILVENGDCTEDDLRSARRYLAAEEIFDLFVWKEGKFEFLAGDSDSSGPFADLWFDVGSLAMEAARRIDELPRAMASVPEGEVYVKNEGPNPKTEAMEKSRDLGRLYQLIDGTRTVHDITDDFYRGRFDTWKGLESLLEWKLIRVAAPEEVLEAGNAAMASRAYARAARLYKRLSQHHPEDDKIRQLVADALRDSGEKRAAAEQLVWVGNARLEAGKGLPAVEAFRQAMSLDGSSAEAHEGLMRALAASGQVDEALDAARTAAGLRISLGDYDGACKTAEAGLAERPGDPQLLIVLANANQGMGKSAEAVRILDDVAQILESTAESDRKLIDVYKRILQIDPQRKDCQRRIDEINASERMHRKKLMQRVAIAAGVLVLAGIAFPLMRPPSAAVTLQKVRLLVDEADTKGPGASGPDRKKAEEAQALLATLAGRSLGSDDEIDKRGLEDRIDKLMHPPESVSIKKRMEQELDKMYRAAATFIQDEHVAEGLSALDGALDFLDGPEAKKLKNSDATGLDKIRTDSVHEVQIAIGNAASIGQKVASRVTGIRDRFVDDVWKREDLDVLHELTEQSALVLAGTSEEAWKPVPELQQKLIKRTRAPKDGTDKKLVEAVSTICESYVQVQEFHDRALARGRRKELKEGYKSAYSNGSQLERDGKIEEALTHYDAFLLQCESLRTAVPEKLYLPIKKELFGIDMQLDQRIKTSRDRLSGIIRDSDEAQKAEANGDASGIEAAFRIRKRLVHDHPDIDLSARFRLPLLIETAPSGAEVYLVDGSPTGQALGKTPVSTQYPIAGNVKYQIHLAGYKSYDLFRKGASEDGSGVERIDLAKLAVWKAVPSGLSTTTAAPTGAPGSVIVCGRSGTVRRIDVQNGTETPAFDPKLLDGFAGSAAVRDDRVYAVALDGTGFILDRNSLAKLDAFTTGRVSASPLATRYGVVVADESGAVRLVEHGRFTWTKQIGRVKCEMALAGERILLVTADADLVLLSASTGDVVQHKSLRSDAVWGPPVVRGARAFLGNESGDVMCVDSASLSELWTKKLDGPASGHPFVTDLRVVTCTANGAIHVLDAETGDVLDKKGAGGKTLDGVCGLPDGGYVLVTVKGIATRFDLTGKVVWRFDAAEEVTAPARLVEGWIILVTRKGTVICLAP